MKKVNVKKLLTLAFAICLTFAMAFAFAPSAAIKAKAAGDITNPAPWEPTSNTDFSSAWNDIVYGGHVCYKVDIPADGLFTATLMGKNSSDLVYSIRKAQSLDHSSQLDHTSICNYSDSPVTATRASVVSAGTYYITIENQLGGKTAQYRLKTEYESFGVAETPDSYDSPKPLSIGTTYTDAITLTDTEDWYKVTILENGKFTFRYSAFQNDVKFMLKDADLHQITEMTGFKNSTGAQDLFLNAGTYYVHVQAWPSKYIFSLDNAKINQTSIKKIKAVKGRKADITFKNADNVTGYQIRYSTDKKFSKNVKVKLASLLKTRALNGNKRVYTATKLKSGQKYYFQIRTYVEKNNGTFYSDWSKSKSFIAK